MCQTEGIWYSLVVYDEIYSAVPLCGSDFDCPEEERAIPHWISDEKFSEQLTPLFLKEPYIEEIKEILWQLIEESPKKTILFQTRYQCPDKEIIEGVLPFEVFWKLLLEQKLLFNTCYIVHKGDTGMPDIDEEEDE